MTSPEETAHESVGINGGATWSQNLLHLWNHRQALNRVALGAAVLSACIAFLLPNQYTSKTSILPPEQTSSSVAMLAALNGRSGAAGLGSVTGGLLGLRSNGELFIDLLHSGTVTGTVINDFHLQQVYGNRYAEDTGKKLATRTEVVENKKSGVITISVTDPDRTRAQAMARDYVDQLNRLVSSVSTSSAHRERVFIEQRLAVVQKELLEAQTQLSTFSSKTATIDIKEQTRATVEAGARMQGQLIVAESELESLKQIYGDQNVRVRAAAERVALLHREINKIGGNSPSDSDTDTHDSDLYPGLRKLPALGVQWADLYRRVRVHETVFEMLSAQDEAARMQEAKEIPTVSIIDAAGIPERKSSPHRLTIIVACTAMAWLAMAFFLLSRQYWNRLDSQDEVKVFLRTINRSRQSTTQEQRLP